MSIGSRIAKLRHKLRFTQDYLAQLLNVSCQDVVNWETEQCHPDISLLPTLADIFEVSIDELFDRKQETKDKVTKKDGISWADDNDLRVVVYRGHQMLESSRDVTDHVFRYEGYVKNIYSALSVSCGNVGGDIEAGSSVCCGNVEGDINAGSHIQCGNVHGDIDAGSYIQCADVGGNVDAGTNVKCGNVAGDIDAGGDVKCNMVQGKIVAAGAVVNNKVR